MACTGKAGDSSDTDEEIGPLKSHGSSNKRLVSSSEDETHLQQCNKTPSSAKNDGTDSQRRSQRKRHQRFQMLSREERWNSITTESAVSKRLSRLKPKKLINDFTRVTHRYNYDYVEVSGEESMDDFIKATDGSESSESNSSEEGKRKQMRHRVKGYRPRIAKLSDESSDEGQAEASVSQSEAQTHLRNCPEQCNDNQEENGKHLKKQRNQRKVKIFTQTRGHQSKDTNSQYNQENSPLSSDEDEQPVSSVKKSRRKSALDSDSDEPNHDSSPDDSPKIKASKNSQTPNVLNSDSDTNTQPYVLSNDRESQDLNSHLQKSMKRPALVLDNDSEVDTQPTTVDEKGSQSKESAVSSDQNQNKLENSVKRSCESEYSKTVLTSLAPKTNACSSDSAITIDDSDDTTDHESDCATSDEDSCQDSTDDGDAKVTGRIQKLAARKRKKRDCMFEKFRSVRSKREKKM